MQTCHSSLMGWRWLGCTPPPLQGGPSSQTVNLYFVHSPLSPGAADSPGALTWTRGDTQGANGAEVSKHGDASGLSEQ